MRTAYLVGALICVAVPTAGYFYLDRYVITPRNLQHVLLGEVITEGLPEYDRLDLWEEQWSYRVSPDVAARLEACLPGDPFSRMREDRPERVCTTVTRSLSDGARAIAVFEGHRIVISRVVGD